MRSPHGWLTALLLVLTTTLAIGEDRPAADPGFLDRLCRDWTHSREEEEATRPAVRVYRATGSRKFPPSRFRGRCLFRRDGTCGWLELSPTDGHRMLEGRWKHERTEKGETRLHLHLRGGRTLSWRILELTGDLLRVEEIKAPPSSP